MATKTAKRKPAKKVAAKIKNLIMKKKTFTVVQTSKRKVVIEKRKPKVTIEILGPNAAELMKNPAFKVAFEQKKQAIIDGYKDILCKKSPPFCKIINDVTTGLRVLLMIVPENDRNIKKSGAAVIVSTMVGNINYSEAIGHGNLKRACEYIADFEQKQSARFCETAVSEYARDIVNRTMPMGLLPQNLHKINEQAKAEVKNYPDLSKVNEAKK